MLMINEAFLSFKIILNKLKIKNTFFIKFQA